MFEALANFGLFIWNTLQTIRIWDIVDILIVTILFYQILRFFQNTKSTQLLKGILLVLLFVGVSKALGLTTLNFILESTLQFGVLALIILFQPELRRLLEQFGKKTLKISIFNDDSKTNNFTVENVEAITRAVFNLASNRTGALIAFERETHLGEIIDTGTRVNAECSDLLIENIFFHNSPLHDGGMVISKGKITAAACLFPLSENKEIASDLGTRHRAGIGLSEATDAIIVIVSEETGTVSIATNGVLKRGFSREGFKEQLASALVPPSEKKERKFFGKVWDRK